ncbi:hypothetical protein MMPV_003407 [Pyropia vietnamensis]
MSEILAKLFIEPETLPGGSAWSSTCLALRELSTAGANQSSIGGASARLASQQYEVLSEAARCTVSPAFGFFQVLLLLIVYGGVLFVASNLIADGSELLLLVPSLRSIVGSVVLPILGAVPDGAIVLFSGLGPNAQEEVGVGVGALAGSTIMLLTVPFAQSIWAGRVNISPAGEASYGARPKLSPPGNLHPTSTGVQPNTMVAVSGRIMLITAVPYFIIQIPALFSGSHGRQDGAASASVVAAGAATQKWWAFAGLVCCMVAFVWYLWYQIFATTPVDDEFRASVVDQVKAKAIRKHDLSLTAAFFSDLHEAATQSSAASPTETTALHGTDSADQRLRDLLRTFFRTYDQDGDGRISDSELQYLMLDLGEKLTPAEISDMLKTFDADGSGDVCFNEFCRCMPNYILSRGARTLRSGSARADAAPTDTEATAGAPGSPSYAAVVRDGPQVHEEDDEEEEVPEDLRHDDPKVQLALIKKRAFTMMGLGTAMVLLFSDPMCSVLNSIGGRIGVDPFFISFILAPLASNASELIAAGAYAAKKTKRTITISFATLLGAAIMNNTFCLGIFLLLVWAKGLEWQFTAETMAILVVEAFMFYFASKRNLVTRDGYLILSLFPLSLLLCFFLQNVVGLN